MGIRGCGVLLAYNTDYIAIRALLAEREISVTDTFAVKGSGGMAKAVVVALRDAGFRSGAVIARNEFHAGLVHLVPARDGTV
jgi:shikimate 5-dehydrogenase